MVIDRTTKDVLKRFDLATASVFAHSQGTMIANHAIEDLVHGGVDTKGMKMYYDGAAANYFATKHIAKEAGATLERFAGHPLDPVHNIIGLNTVNPLRIVGSIIAAPLIFQGDRSWSSHTNLRGGERLQWFNNSVLFK